MIGSNLIRRLSAGALSLAVAVASPALEAQSVETLPDRDEALDGAPEEVFTVGSLDGESWELLSGVRDADFDSEGNLYILDAGSHRVLKFDANGNFLLQFGSEGEGPGEMSSPINVDVLADGRIAVRDLSRQSFAVFDSDGEYVENYGFGGGLGRGTQNVFATPNGGLLYQGSQIDMGGGTDVTEPEARDEVPVLHHPLDGTDESTLFEAAIPKPDVRNETSGSSGGQTMRISMRQTPVWAASLRWSVLPSGAVAVASKPEYAIDVFDATGSPIRSIRRDLTPQVVTDALKEAYMERRREAMESGGGPRISFSGGGGGASTFQLDESMVEQMLANTQFASTVPVIRSVGTTGDGTIWIMRETEEPGEGEGPIDLVSESGEYLGTITGQPMPSAFGPDGLVAYIETDEEWEFEKVVVRRLPAEWR